jgi:hypothetical protein
VAANAAGPLPFRGTEKHHIMEERQDVDWPAVKRAYEGKTCTVAHICEHFAIHPSLLYARVERDRWEMRRPVYRHRENQRTVERMRRMVRREIGSLSAELDAAPGALPLAERERLARVLTSLARLLDKIADIEGKLFAARAETPAEAAAASAQAAGADDDTRRESIAERIDALRARFREEHGAGGVVAGRS